MDEAQLGAWQVALVQACKGARDTTEVRERLAAAVPWASTQIAKLDDRALAVAIDLVRRWAPAERG